MRVCYIMCDLFWLLDLCIVCMLLYLKSLFLNKECPLVISVYPNYTHKNVSIFSWVIRVEGGWTAQTYGQILSSKLCVCVLVTIFNVPLIHIFTIANKLMTNFKYYFKINRKLGSGIYSSVQFDHRRVTTVFFQNMVVVVVLLDDVIYWLRHM